MTCTTEAQLEKKLTVIFAKDLKASNIAHGLGKSHDDIMKESRQHAKEVVRVNKKAAIDDFADEVDKAAALPGGVVQELNKAEPRVVSSISKAPTKVTVTEVNNNKVFVRFGKGKKIYEYTPGEVSLNQKDTQTVINKYTSGNIAKKPVKEQTNETGSMTKSGIKKTVSSTILNQTASTRGTFKEELNRKLQRILKKLFPKINLSYTIEDIDGNNDKLSKEVTDGIKLGFNVIDILNDLSTAKPSKHGGESQPVLKTIRLDNKIGIRKILAGKGASKESIDFMFRYMKEHNIDNISTKDLLLGVYSHLSTSVTLLTSHIRLLKDGPINSIADLEEVAGLDSSDAPKETMTRIRKFIESKGKEDIQFIRNEFNVLEGLGDAIVGRVQDPNYIEPAINSIPYQHLTVPGGHNYREKEIATPNVTARLQGHADFATKNGIGWFRVDEDIDNSSTLRILEMQSDMFQRRKDENLMYELHPLQIVITDMKSRIDDQKKLIKTLPKDSEILDTATNKLNYFKSELKRLTAVYSNVVDVDLDKGLHQLLNTNNKWVSFFIQSIVQDSEKKGYTSIKFPAGETAAKVEGHNTVANRLKEVRKEISSVQQELSDAIANTAVNDPSNNQLIKEKIASLKKVEKTLQTDGLEKLAPIEGFYQVRVKNTLYKLYGKNNIKTITDEHGNQWFELKLNKTRDSHTIMLQKQQDQIAGQANIEAKTVLINSLLQSQDTLPHEYAHHYIRMFKDAPIVKEAIKKWGSEEALVQAIGEQVVKQKGEAYGWWKTFTKWLKGLFDDLSSKDKEELKNLLTDGFLTNKDLNADIRWNKNIAKKGTILGHVSDEDFDSVKTAKDGGDISWLGFHIGTTDVVEDYAKQTYSRKNKDVPVNLYTIKIKEDLVPIELEDNISDWDASNMVENIAMQHPDTTLTKNSSKAAVIKELNRLGYNAVAYHNNGEGAKVDRRINSIIILDKDTVEIVKKTPTTISKLPQLLSDENIVSGTVEELAFGSKKSNKNNDKTQQSKEMKDVHGNIKKMRELLKDLHDLGGGKENSSHLAYLDGLLARMKPEFFEKMTTYINEKATETHGMAKNTYINIDVSDKPYSMRNQQSEAEVYVHEVIHSMVMFALRADTRESRKLKTQLEHIMDTVSSKITPKDFMPENPTKEEEKAAKEMYKYIFTGPNRIDEFLSHALTNQTLMDIMQDIDIKEQNKPKKLMDKIIELFHTAMEILTGNYSFKDRNKNSFEQTMNIAFQLAETNNRALKERNDHINVATRVWDMFQDLNQKTADYIDDVWSTYADKGDYRDPPKGRGWDKAKWLAGAVFKMLTNRHYRKALELMLSGIGLKPQGDIQSIFRDFFKGDELTQSVDMQALLSSRIDAAKVSWTSTIIDLIHSPFKHKLTNEEEEAITSVIVDTDLVSISKKFGKKGLAQVLSSDEEVDRRISRAHHALKLADPNYYYWNYRQAEGLGYYMATGEAHTAQNFNAENIARGLNSGHWRKPKWKAVALIDEIATLTALKYTNKADKAIVKELVKTDRAGIENIMRIHEDFKKDAEEKVFKDGRTNIIKGYSKGTFDSSIDMKVAPLADKEKLKALGYELKAELPKNKKDITNKKMGMYIASSFEISNWQRGATRLTRIGSRGTTLSEAAANDNIARSRVDYVREGINKEAVNIAEAMNKKDFDVSTLQYNMSPVMDNDGEVTDYRYVMTKRHKKELLKQDTRVSTVLSHSFAHTIDKEGTREQNKDVLDIITKDMKDNYNHGNYIGNNLKEYISITKNSANKEIQELYKVLPPIFKDAMKKNKYGELAVRADLLHTYFGYRHISIANNKFIQAITPEIMRKVIKVGEYMWQEFIKISKVDILIKMPAVVIGNLISNFFYGVMTGTAPWTLIGDYIESSRRVSRYFKRHTELMKLQLAKKTGNVNKLDLSRIPMLESQLADSSIHELSELGIYQSIVEDMEHVELDSTNRIKKEVDDILNKAPKFVKDGVNLLYLTENTKYFKFVNAVLTKSDLVARDIENRKLKRIQEKQADGKMPLPKWYVMKGREHIKSYKYKKTTKRLIGKEKEEFMKEADKVRHETVLNAFVNYETPSGPIEEYLNKIGAIMFTKYAKRIQRVISETGVKNPLNVATMLLSEEVFGDLETIYDQSLFTRSWYNLGLGAGDLIPGVSPFDRMMEVFSPPLVQLVTNPLN